jgi:hypothetical protein
MSPREAEVAAENYLKTFCEQTRRTVRSKWHKIDFFGADVIGKTDVLTYYVQVTTAKDPASRRRKLEVGPWSAFDRVKLFQVVERNAVANAHRIERFFRVHNYDFLAHKWYIDDKPIPITKDMLKVKHLNAERGPSGQPHRSSRKGFRKEDPPAQSDAEV